MDNTIGLLRIMGLEVPSWAQGNEAMDGLGLQDKLDRWFDFSDAASRRVWYPNTSSG